MAISIDKVLSMSAKDWSTMTGKELKNYEAKGIHSDSCMISALKEFAENVPKKAEVVVDYKFTSATEGSSGGMSAMMYCSGVALIPKR
jgi:hypothetical protein